MFKFLQKISDINPWREKTIQYKQQNIELNNELKKNK